MATLPIVTTPAGATRQLPRLTRSETTAAGLLLLATAAAILWVNSRARLLRAFWHTEAALRLGDYGISLDLRHWVNDGLMALFFFVVGLEVKRELSMGELTDRTPGRRCPGRRLTGLACLPLIYLAFNPERRGGAGVGRGDLHRHRVPARRCSRWSDPAGPGRCGCSC